MDNVGPLGHVFHHKDQNQTSVVREGRGSLPALCFLLLSAMRKRSTVIRQPLWKLYQ